MWRILRGLGRQAGTMQFRRRPYGWIFRAPAPWLFGRRPHYRVDEGQKERIERVLGAGHLITYVLLTFVLLWLVLYPTSGLGLVSPASRDHLFTFILSVLSLGPLHSLFQYLVLRPLL